MYRGESRGGVGWGRTPLKLEKNMIFWRKIVIFHRKYPNNFRASLRSAQFFQVRPHNLKSWIRPWCARRISRITFNGYAQYRNIGKLNDLKVFGSFKPKGLQSNMSHGTFQGNSEIWSHKTDGRLIRV